MFLILFQEKMELNKRTEIPMFSVSVNHLNAAPQRACAPEDDVNGAETGGGGGEKTRTLHLLHTAGGTLAGRLF